MRYSLLQLVFSRGLRWRLRLTCARGSTSSMSRGSVAPAGTAQTASKRARHGAGGRHSSTKTVARRGSVPGRGRCATPHRSSPRAAHSEILLKGEASYDRVKSGPMVIPSDRMKQSCG